MILKKDFICFDLETQRSFFEVGSRKNIDKLKMSLAVIYDSRDNKCHTYLEPQASELIAHIESAPLVIGFNHILFDYEVLSFYRGNQDKTIFLNKLKSLNNLDLMLNIKDELGFFVSLQNLAMPTLNIAKSADGLKALEWYKQYLKTQNKKYIAQIEDYCRQDVIITKDLYLYGLRNDKVFLQTKAGEIKYVKVDWAAALTQIKEKQAPSNQLNLF